MTTNFQFPSILIPHVWDNITKERIVSVFENLHIADVARVDMIPRENSTSFMAFVHMNQWYNNIAAQNLRNKIIEGNEGRIVYDDPWHWVVVMAKNPRLNLINEVSSFKTDISTSNQDVDPRVQQVKQNVTLLANQIEAQGKMIRYLRDDLFNADSYIFDLEHQINELQEENIEKTIEIYSNQEQQKEIKQSFQKVRFANVDTNPSMASSPSKLPTPTSTGHYVDNLTINTDINISDEEIDDGDIDCGDFSEMATRHVAKELEMLRNQHSERSIMSHI